MKLTIKNPEKIVNEPLPTGFGMWVVSAVEWTEEYYEFHCEYEAKCVARIKFGCECYVSEIEE